MKCPYCKVEIQEGSLFCPECGQSIVKAEKTDVEKTYWEKINCESVDRQLQYRKDIEKKITEDKSEKSIKVVNFAGIACVVMIAIWGAVMFQQRQIKLTKQVMNEMIGKTFNIGDSHIEGLGNKYYEYWELEFVDEKELKYSYIETDGPAEDYENPKYKGMYPYTISRSIIGKYTLKTNDEEYYLEVNENNVPIRIRLQ